MSLKEIYNTTKTITDKSHVINFGKKHKGRTVGELMTEDPEFLLFCHHNIDWFDLSYLLIEEMDEMMNERRS